jgi:sec-independent protein translocase protein TatA
MFGLGPTELIMIIVVALVIFGPSQLPKVGKSVGEAVKSFRHVREQTNDVQDKVKKDLENMILGPPENN